VHPPGGEHGVDKLKKSIVLDGFPGRCVTATLFDRPFVEVEARAWERVGSLEAIYALCERAD
jgi:hypothetical protein